MQTPKRNMFWVYWQFWRYLSSWLRGVKVKALVAQSCWTLCSPMDCNPSGSSVHGILQARILRWVAIPFSRESSWSRDQTQASCTAGRFFTIRATQKQTKITHWNPGSHIYFLTSHPLLSFCDHLVHNLSQRKPSVSQDEVILKSTDCWVMKTW